MDTVAFVGREQIKASSNAGDGRHLAHGPPADFHARLEFGCRGPCDAVAWRKADDVAAVEMDGQVC